MNEDVPTEDELRQVIKKQKDSNCQGTDKIYAEHIKSDKLIGAVLLLFTMIWTMVKVPDTWLASVITYLKKCLKSEAKITVPFLS